MYQRLLIALGAATTAALLTAGASQAQVIYEDEGLYEKETWNVGKLYDDLDDPTDQPGIITKGINPRSPSGPAVDFEARPGSMVPPRIVPESGEGNLGAGLIED